MSDILTVDPDVLADRVVRALQGQGVSGADARTQAWIWLEAELRGQPSHGVQRLRTMVGRIRNGRVNVHARPSWSWVTPSVLTVDGDNGLGPVVALSALAQLDERAGTQGIVMAVIRRSHHLGMLAPYVEWLADHGRIGIALSTSEALVHPWGGSPAMVGTNPLAIAVPARPEQPLVMDMSTGATSRGRILHHARTATALQEGWAVDAAGRPTTDPQAALDGAISPFGGAKGYALGVALGALVGALTGTEFGQRVTGTLDETEPTTKGDVFIAVDPRAIGEPDAGPRVAAYLDQVRSTPTAEGFTEVLVPGDRARRSRERAQVTGIRIDLTLWNEIQSLASEAGSA